MIKKFKKIKSVGRFKNFSALGDLTFDKVNIIYGENSAGKSTLTSIIRSLISNKTELILERKTLGTDGEQDIELLFEYDNNKQVSKFQNSKWNNWNDDLKNTEIFDELFISENIYTGLDILSEHQKYLYQFAIGEEGVNLAKDIEGIKKDLQSKKYPALNSLSGKIRTLTERYFEVEQFVNLTEDGEIDKKIEEKKREISTATASNEIRVKQGLEEIKEKEEKQFLLLPFDLVNLKSILDKSLPFISEEALQRTTQHINKLTNVLQEDAEEWLHKGILAVKEIKDNKCPFCQQDLKEAEPTIKLYQQYFNEEYKKLKETIDKCTKQIREINIEQLLNNIKNIILNNNVLIEFWKKFLPSIEFPKLKNLEENNSQIAGVFRRVKSLVENKSKSPMVSIKGDDIDNLLRAIEIFNTAISDYNSKIKKANIEIDSLKKRHLDIDKLEEEFKKLEIQKKRYSDNIRLLCDGYQKCQDEIEKLKKQVEQKKEDLNRAISQKAEKYGAETNTILEKFGVPFRIVKHTPRYRGRGEEPYFEYFLEMEGVEVNPLQKAKFILGGGDRNALALAFFLAKIFVDENIESKIIILDDPISSFDINRKRRTIEFIRDLSNKAKQTILFTHLNTFAFELYDYVKDIGIKPKCLQIKNGEIKEWDINEDKKHPFFKNLSKLEVFLSGNAKINLDEARRLIRICLEDKLKFGYFQFFKNLGDDYWLGTMIKRLRDLKNDPNLKFKHSNKDEVINELGNLCDFSGPSHHSNITTSYKTDYTRTEIANYVKSTLKLIYEWL